jgi:hypothetical protein
MQPHKGRDPQTKGTKTTKEHNGKSVLFLLHHTRSVLRGGPAKQHNLVLRVVERGRVFGMVLLMGCSLEDYRARVGSWNAKTSWRTAQGRESNAQSISYIRNMLLCAVALTALLVIDGVEQNPEPGVEADNSLQVLCSGRERNLKSGTQCDMCGRCFHNSCGHVKVQMADSGKWSCDRCRWDRLRRLEEKLENALQQIEELKQKNKMLEEAQLRGAVAGFEVGSRDTVRRQHEGAECSVLGDSIIRNVESEHVRRAQCFPGIGTEQLQRVMESRDLVSPDTVVIHIGTIDLRRTENLDYVMGDVYALVNKTGSFLNPD